MHHRGARLTVHGRRPRPGREPSNRLEVAAPLPRGGRARAREPLHPPPPQSEAPAGPPRRSVTRPVSTPDVRSWPSNEGCGTYIPLSLEETGRVRIISL